MSYTETTRTSWFARLRNALVLILVGFILVVGAGYFLFWNEGRAIQTYRGLVEGASLVVDVDSGSVDPANDGKLIHITGPVQPEGTPEDSMFGISAPGALRVSRDVEMYQWVENKDTKTEKNVGGSEETTTTYSYAKEWRSDVVDSSEFKQPGGHENPGLLIDSSAFVVDTAKVGAFTMPGDDVANLGESTDIRLKAEDVERFGGALGTDRRVVMDNGGVYVGNSVNTAQVGDMRVRYKRVDLKEASFVGAQSGEQLVAYTVSNGREVFLSAAGKATAAEMFTSAQQANTIITWLIRLGGLIGMFIGFCCIFSIFGVIGDLIPFIGSIVRFGTSAVAAVLTALLGPLIIAIGWFAYRPLLALAIIAVGVAVAAAFYYLRRKRGPAATVPLGRPAA